MEQFFKKNLLVIEMPYLYSLAKYNFKTTSRLSIARGEHRKKINEKKPLPLFRRFKGPAPLLINFVINA